MIRNTLLFLVFFSFSLKARAQLELFAAKSDEITLQLVISSNHKMAAISWNRGNKCGFALAQQIDIQDQKIVLRQPDGHVLLEGQTNDRFINARLNTGDEALDVELHRMDIGRLSNWRYLRAEGSFRHKTDRGTGAIIDLNYLFPEDDKLQMIETLAHYYGLDPLSGPAQSMMQADVNNYLDRYRQMSTASEGNALEMNWMKSAVSLPVFVNHAVICFVKSSVVSAGQQSVRTHNDFALIATDSQRSLAFEDVFTPESKEILSVLLDAALRELYTLDTSISLRQAGFFSEMVMSNNNIVLGAGSIGFAYNVYELGPPAKGQPILMLPLSVVEPLLQSDFKLLLR
jgi:hypothetical protein